MVESEFSGRKNPSQQNCVRKIYQEDTSRRFIGKIHQEDTLRKYIRKVHREDTSGRYTRNLHWDDTPGCKNRLTFHKEIFIRYIRKKDQEDK